MQVTYYGFQLVNKISNEKHLVDISGFLRGFSEANCQELKSRITFQEEHLILSKCSENVFSLVMTRDIYRLKSVNPQKQTIKELSDNLSPGERFGVASYIYIKDHLIAVVTPQLAPKFDAFISMLETLLANAGLSGYAVHVHPLIKTATKDEAVKMQFMGTTVIEVGRQNGWFRKILNTVNVNSAFDELDSIEITFKPKKRKNIKPIVKQLLETAEDDDLHRFSVKAKNEASSALMELYLNGRGVIRDTISPTSEEKIPVKLVEKISRNYILKERLEEFTGNGEFNKSLSDKLNYFANVERWTSLPCNLQDTFILV